MENQMIATINFSLSRVAHFRIPCFLCCNPIAGLKELGKHSVFVTILTVRDRDVNNSELFNETYYGLKTSRVILADSWSCQGPTVDSFSFFSSSHKVAPVQEHTRFRWINVRTSKPTSIHHRQYQKCTGKPFFPNGRFILGLTTAI